MQKPETDLTKNNRRVTRHKAIDQILHGRPEEHPQWLQLPCLAGGVGSRGYMHRAGSGDVIRSDTWRKGSNRMEDKDRRTYNDQVLTGRRFGP